MSLWIWDEYSKADEDVNMVKAPAELLQLGLRLTHGESGPERLPIYSFTAQATQDGILNDAIGGHVQLVSDRLRKVIESAKVTNVEWHSAKVVRAATGEVVPFHIMNIVGAVLCVDFTRSKLELRDNGSIRFIDKLMLKNDLPNLPPLFRIKEFLPLIVVGDALRQAVESAGCSGLRMIAPENVSL